MIKSNANMAQQIAQAAIAFEKKRTGHSPKSVTVVMSDNTLMITLHGALSPAEIALAKSPAGAAKVQDVSPPAVHQLRRFAAAGNQKNHRGRGTRSNRGSRTDHRHRRASVHHRHRRAGVLARLRCAERNVEWKWIARSFMKMEFHHAGSDQEMPGNHRGRRGGRLRAHAQITVLGDDNGKVRLGFEAADRMFRSIAWKFGSDSAPMLRSPAPRKLLSPRLNHTPACVPEANCRPENPLIQATFRGLTTMNATAKHPKEISRKTITPESIRSPPQIRSGRR